MMLITIVKVSYLTIINGLECKYQRYTFDIIDLWEQAALNSSSRRLTAMNTMSNLSYNSNPGKW